VLDVEEHWSGEPGAPPCGPGSALRGGDACALMLRNLACEMTVAPPLERPAQSKASVTRTRHNREGQIRVGDVLLVRPSRNVGE
jgi:hypothetical protein